MTNQYWQAGAFEPPHWFMKYELAKQLKDAGFPLVRIEAGMCVRGEYLDFNPEGDEILGAQHFYSPTLEKLIEECGESLSMLVHVSDMNAWDAVHVLGRSIRAIEPIDTVAYFWLALQQK